MIFLPQGVDSRTTDRIMTDRVKMEERESNGWTTDGHTNIGRRMLTKDIKC